jgi:hypothetical protein
MKMLDLLISLIAFFGPALVVAGWLATYTVWWPWE